jgi:hypothetical protein
MPPSRPTSAAHQGLKSNLAKHGRRGRTELARAKIAANEAADRISANLRTWASTRRSSAPVPGHGDHRAEGAGRPAGAGDRAHRRAAHRAAEQKRLDAERERIRVVMATPAHFNVDPVVVEKDGAVRSEGYRRLVASMACARCGRAAPSQHCHLDLGKGGAIKTDDRMAWPGCADGPSFIGCHTIIGGSGIFAKTERRAVEAQLVLGTLRQIQARGRWPAKLPQPTAAQIAMLERWAA